MSRSGIAVAGFALLLAAGSLVLQFVLPQEAGDSVDVASLQSQIDELKNTSGSSPDLRIAYIDAEDAFTVFLEAVSDLREKAAEKRDEIIALQQELQSGTISQEDYSAQANELSVELLDAQLTIDMGTLDRMIESSAFSDIRSQLQTLRESGQAVADEVKNLVSMARVGVIEPVEFASRYEQAKEAFTQFDQLLTQAALSRIVAAARNIALEKGYDLVLKKENVIVYGNSATVTDITDLVKGRISSYL